VLALVATFALWSAWAATAHAAGGWSIEPSAALTGIVTGNVTLTGVSCTSGRSCIAVGGYTDAAGARRTLAARWDGRRWSIQPTPQLTAATGVLDAISCTSSTFCIAVGSDSTGALVERWTGRRWARQIVPPEASGEVSRVSCGSPTRCLAVGTDTALSWNGRRWSAETPPKPSGAYAVTLQGVSCSTSAGCTVVGSYQTGPMTAPGGGATFGSGGRTLTLAEHWDGAHWSIQSTPNPTGAVRSTLWGVACPSAHACTGVGTDSDTTGHGLTLIERWTGSRWAIDARGTRIAGGLSDVACPATTACVAVGSYPKGTLVQRWNGKRWTTRRTRSAATVTSANLMSVTCTGPSACSAVGTYVQYPGAVTRTLLERSSGAGWTRQTTPRPTGPAAGSLSGIGCASVSACIAVGSYYPDGGKVPLAEQWNGTSWSLLHTAKLGGRGGFLTSVACTAADACTAVGYDGALLAERWDGATWSTEPIPNTTWGGTLLGVACWSPTGCVAVGGAHRGADIGDTFPLAELWDGTHWTVVPSANPPGTTDARLESVSCPSATACTAVGYDYNLNHNQLPIVEQWNGVSWVLEPSASGTGPGQTGLASISCPSSGACTAVGDNGATLAEGWNGTTWSIEPTPDLGGATGGYLGSVSCPASNACTAVGSHTLNFNSDERTVAERWNGAAWSVQSTPNPSDLPLNSLAAVSCPSSAACLAVGLSTSGGRLSGSFLTPLTERWSAGS
jgi:hypothetical protein